jgi:hypothetical protein
MQQLLMHAVQTRLAKESGRSAQHLAKRSRTMPLSSCVHCGLPTRIHFAWCQESGAKGDMPPEALRPGAVIAEARELRYCKPVRTQKARR